MCDQIETLVYGSNNIAVDEFLRVSCKTSLAIKEGDEKFCDNNGVDKDKCYFGMAFVKKDLGMCNRISGRPGEVVGSYYDYLDRREVCKLNILEKETISNPNLCRQLGSEFIIEECIMNSVIINKDENVCGMLSSSSVYLKPDACIEAIKSNKE